MHASSKLPEPSRTLRGSAIAALSLFTLFAWTHEAAAQAKRPIQANDLYRIRTASSVALSPDGQQLAFVVTQIDSVENAYYSHIWLTDVSGGPPRQHTRGKVRDRHPVWSPDGTTIAFVSDRSGDDPQVYVIPVDGGEARALTEMENGAFDPVWSPDGDKLLFGSELTTRELEAAAGRSDTSISAVEGAAADTAMWGSIDAIRNWLAKNAENEEPAVITRLDFQGERQLNPIESWAHIFIIDLREKKPRRLTDGPYDFRDPSFSPDGKRIAFVAKITGDIPPDYSVKTDLYVMDMDGGEPRKLDIPERAISEPSWSPDGSSIAFAGRDTADRSAANTEIGVIEFPSGEEAVEVTWLTRALDRSARQYCWSPDGAAIYFTAGVHGTVPIYRVRVSDGEIRQMVSGERGVLGFDLGSESLAYVVTEPANPSEIYISDPAGDGERRVTDLNTDWLSDVHVQAHRGFYYRSYDGRRIQGWLIEPLDYDSRNSYPLALEIHGGPHAMWGPGESTMWLEFQLLAANGYFVLYTNPRGSGGYGHDFKFAIQREWGEGPMRDVLTAVDTVVQLGQVDEDRMVVTGGSYAGYLTAYLVGHDHRFKAAVAQRGVYDLATFFGEGNAWRLVPWEFDTYPWEDYEILRAESPITHAHLIQTPLLIMHSDRDLRTGVSQSEMLYRTLMVLRRPVEYVRYPRAGHDLSRTGEPLQRIDRLLRILEFFDRHVNPGSQLPSASR
ncbi:MAG: S9 family peptidase [Gemmatimonadota bacterium]|jgi:dipeptidyl aminopeptidase/acylaminoacyl peptidase